MESINAEEEEGFVITEMLEIKSDLKKVTAEKFKEQEINWNSLFQFSEKASIPNVNIFYYYYYIW